MSTDRIRTALQRLVELDDTVPHNRPGWIQEWTDATACARTALAEPADGPAAVAGELSDDELWALGDTDAIRFARAVIAADRSRRAAAPAADRLKPLWEVMGQAYARAGGHQAGYAAEIDAVADWLDCHGRHYSAAAALRTEARRGREGA